MAVGDGDILYGVLNRFRATVRKGLADGTLEIGQSINVTELMSSEGITVTGDQEERVIANLVGYVSSAAGGLYPHGFKYELSGDGNDLVITPVPDNLP